MATPRLIFVTGKGGTGKSTIAAVLATALARRRPSLLADLDQRSSAARLLADSLNGNGAAPVAGNLEIQSLSARHELELFIERIVPLKALSRRMLESRTFGYVTAALPGLEAFLMLERLRHLAGEAARLDRYVVIDAPATGTSLELLSVASNIAQLAPSGTLNRLARELADFLSDRARFAVVLSLQPEELALREALETATILKARVGITPFAALLNGVAKPLFEPAETAPVAALGAEHARLAARRVELALSAERAREQLEAAGLALVELPMVFKPTLGRAEILELSQLLEQDFCE